MSSLLRNKQGFTLVEMVVSMVLMSMVLLAMYTAFQGIVINQARLQSEIDLNSHGYYATEKLIQLIKDGGGIDYEEYWNRRVRGYDRGFFYWENEYSDNTMPSSGSASRTHTVGVGSGVEETSQNLVDNGATFSYANLGYFGNVVPGVGSDAYFDPQSRRVDSGNFGDIDAALSTNRDYDFLYCGSNFVTPGDSSDANDLLENSEKGDNCFNGDNNRPGTVVTDLGAFSGEDLFLTSITKAGPVQKYRQYEIFHIDTNFDQDSNYGEADFALPDSSQPYNPLESEGIAQIGFTDGPGVFGCHDSVDSLFSAQAECDTGSYSIETYGMPELYLTKQTPSGQERTYFRHIYKQDSSLLKTTCEKGNIDAFNDPGHTDYRNFDILDGCFGTIQIAKLISVDIDYDGNIDWWKPHPNYRGIGEIYDPINGDEVYADIEWIDIFPLYVNVLDARFFVAPEKDQEYVGLEEGGNIPTSENLVQPYLRINLTLGVGGSKRHIFNDIDKQFVYSTVVNLEG